jgi:recA bacterial DNA recombination protein
MPVSPKIIELRKILAERYPQQTEARSVCLPTGWSPLDSLLGGGLPKGAITQLLIPNISSGGAIVLHEIIEAMQEISQYVALIDSKNCFEPVVDHPLLLWIRCHTVLQALKATDLILRDGNLSLVILDFKENLDQDLKKIPASAWYRFQRIIEENRNALLTITRHPIVNSAQITISTIHRLCIDDLSAPRTDLIKFISLEIHRSRIQREYRYA